MKNNEYRNLLEDMYKENQKFLDKAIFTLSAIAIPFLLMFEKISKNLRGDIGLLLAVSLIGFLGVIVLHLSSLQNARDGCDKNLGNCEKSKKEGGGLFIKAKKQDYWRDRIFIFSLFLTFFAIIIS